MGIIPDTNVNKREFYPSRDRQEMGISIAREYKQTGTIGIMSDLGTRMKEHHARCEMDPCGGGRAQHSYYQPIFSLFQRLTRLVVATHRRQAVTSTSKL